MWIALVVGVVVGWVLLAALIALVLGRAVRVAEQRRPRTQRARRSTNAFARVVELATGQIPVIRPRIMKAVTGAIPIIRPRV